jgi:hypothetical protein
MTLASTIHQGEWGVLNALMEDIKEGEVVPVHKRKECGAM